MPKMFLEFKHDDGERLMSVEAEVDYSPGRAPPAVSNPDAPGFADPGDPPSLEVRTLTIDGLPQPHPGPGAPILEALETAAAQAWRQNYA